MPEPRLTRVLVVDDDPLLCELLRVTLAIEGIEVTAAHHVIHAEKLLAESVPDAIVLDIGLQAWMVSSTASACARARGRNACRSSRSAAPRMRA